MTFVISAVKNPCEADSNLLASILSFNIHALAERLERVFPRMVRIEGDVIVVMDRIRLAETGIIKGSGPAAERVQKVYDEYVSHIGLGPTGGVYERSFLEGLSERMERVFPRMVRFNESHDALIIMDRIEVSEKGIIQGSGPAAERVQRIYSEFARENPTRTLTQLKCPNCGANVLTQAKFCSGCGMTLQLQTTDQQVGLHSDTQPEHISAPASSAAQCSTIRCKFCNQTFDRYLSSCPFCGGKV